MVPALSKSFNRLPTAPSVHYATLNDKYIETQRQIRTWKDKYAALNKAVDDYLSSFEALKKTTD